MSSPSSVNEFPPSTTAKLVDIQQYYYSFARSCENAEKLRLLRGVKNQTLELDSGCDSGPRASTPNHEAARAPRRVITPSWFAKAAAALECTQRRCKTQPRTCFKISTAAVFFPH